MEEDSTHQKQKAKGSELLAMIFHRWCCSLRKHLQWLLPAATFFSMTFFENPISGQQIDLDIHYISNPQKGRCQTSNRLTEQLRKTVLGFT
jgi:hypothetical protein